MRSHALLGALALAVFVLGACGHAGPTLPARVLARGALAYDVAAVDDGVATVELGTGFELVVRAGDGRVRRRIWLGESSWDMVSLAISGRRAAVASLDGRVRLVDLAAGLITSELRLDGAATAVGFSPDGAWLLTGAETGVLCLRRAEDLTLLQCVAAHDARVSAFAFCGDTVASAGWDGRIALWRLPSLRAAGELRRPGPANDVAFAPDCRRVAVAGSAQAPRRPPPVPDDASVVEIWPLDGMPPIRLAGHGAAPVAVAWSGPGRVLSGGWDGTVRAWDARTGHELARQSGYASLVRAIAITAGGRRAWVASWSGSERDGWTLTLLDLP